MPARTILAACAPHRLTTIAMMDATSGDSVRARLGGPKKMENSDTMKGVLHTRAAHTLTTAASGLGPQARAQPQPTPTPTPGTARHGPAATALKASVEPAPRSSTGHCDRTAMKWRWIIGLGLGQASGARPAAPDVRRDGDRVHSGKEPAGLPRSFLCHLVQFMRGLGGGDDLVDLEAQLVLALANAGEVG